MNDMTPEQAFAALDELETGVQYAFQQCLLDGIRSVLADALSQRADGLVQLEKRLLQLEGRLDNDVVVCAACEVPWASANPRECAAACNMGAIGQPSPCRPMLFRESCNTSPKAELTRLRARVAELEQSIYQSKQEGE